MAQEISKSSETNSTQKPQQSAPSHQKTQKHFKATSPTLKGSKQSRNEKRKRWAKKHKPTPKPVVVKAPEKEYLCACHNEPARKPKAGQKEAEKNPESGKVETKSKGLGHWRCKTTGQPTKVTPRKPAAKEEAKTNDTTTTA